MSLPRLPRLPPRTLLITLAVIVGGVALAWQFRWGIGQRTVEILDPVVRRWAREEVVRLSDGAYELTLSRIRVDTERQRVGIDTIVMITDRARNAAREVPLPSMTLRFHNCALEGIDLDRLTARRGLKATRGGCDSVTMSAEVPAPTASGTAGRGEGAFLALQRNLDLGRDVPYISVDSVVFPAVTVALGIAGRGARRTTIAFDRLAVRLDSLHYDPDQPAEERRTLLSRNAALALDGFDGSRDAATRLRVDRFRADLASGTLALDGFEWEPLAGSLADSLGLTALAVDSLRVAGINWRAFLTAGDIRVRRLVLAGGRMRLPPPRETAPGADTLATPAGRMTAERVLRAIDRAMALDTLAVRDLTLVESGRSDSVHTRLGALTVTGMAVGSNDSTWTGPFPIGRVQVAFRDVLRDGGGERLAIGALTLDLATGVLRADSLRAGAAGSDAAWLRGRRWRADRTALAVDSLLLRGLDAPAWVRTGAYRARRLDLHGVDLDISTDKRLPSRRGVGHRSPQAWAREVPPPLHLDTVRVAGRLQYRERGPEAARAGVLRFEDVLVTLTNLSTDPTRMTDTTPVVVDARARLMGSGALRIQAELPLLAPDFRMTYAGTLGRMPATALNPFLVGISPAQFKEGRVLGIGFEATVRDGVARGTVRPRWDSLFIDVVQRKESGGGILGGIKRALTKFAANEFMLQAENTTGGDDPPRNGAIRHRWVPRETLLQFMWAGVRDALLPLVKR